MITISHPDPVGSRGGEGADIHVNAEGNLALADDLTTLAQRCLQRLRYFRGEWFLAVNEGVPYFQEIFARPTPVGLASVILSDEVGAVDEVDGVSGVAATIDPATRRLTWSATIESRYGAAQVETTT